MTPIITKEDITFKLESLNPSGSAKDRALPYQLERLLKLGFTSATISSSGNAAISAAHYCQQNNIPLTIFLSPATSPAKLNLIKSFGFPVNLTATPNSSAYKFAKLQKSYFLRQSTDPAARIGYSTLGTEINHQFPQATSLFIPLGSGTTLLGTSDTLNPNIKLFGVQPASNPPIAKLLDQSYSPESSTITDSLSVKMLPLKSQILKLLTNRGGGVVVGNTPTIQAFSWLKEHQLDVSPETALALAAVWKLKHASPQLVGNYPLIVATGVNRS